MGEIVGALVVLRTGKGVVGTEGDLQERDSNQAECDWKPLTEVCVGDAEAGRIVPGPLDGHRKFVMTLEISSELLIRTQWLL